jgi:sulfonate transport system ATP-binding protein
MTKRYGENTILNGLDLHVPRTICGRCRAQRRRQSTAALLAGLEAQQRRTILAGT